MIEVENTFAKHGVFWMVFMPFLALCLLPALIKPDGFKISAAETIFFSQTLSVDIETSTRRADGWFRSFFIDTGIAPAVKSFFFGGDSSKQLAESTQPSGFRLSSQFARDYNNSLWMMVYRGLWRISALGPGIFALFFCMGIASLVDGLVIRARKSYNFEFHNPVFFWSAAHGVVLVIGLGVFLPFLPIALTPLLLACFFFALCSGLWVTAANFQTGN